MSNTKFVFSSALWKLCAFLFTTMLVMISCKDDDVNKDNIYDPNRSIELNTFYPDSGKYLEKVLLTGSNFGTDPEKVRVYFNSRNAPVIGSTGKRIYVLAPRLPGDTCIISVAIGKDSVIYDKSFIYHTSVSVITIAGNGNRSRYKDGNLAESEVQPRFLCVDKEDNIFIMNWVWGLMNIARIDQEANMLITLEKDMVGNVPAADPVTGIISFPTESTIGSFVTMDPLEMWAPRKREMKWGPDVEIPANAWKQSMAVNPEDGFIYTRWFYGDVLKIDPITYETKYVYTTSQGATWGMTFSDTEPNVLYFTFDSDAGLFANSICSMDVTDPENTFTKRSSELGGGHRDGPLKTAMFRKPSQIYKDSDGSLYIADQGNHCIRRITPNGIVETVLGQPGVAGWKDGGKEEALFNEPSGIGVGTDGSIYVADFMNNRVRKLSIN